MNNKLNFKSHSLTATPNRTFYSLIGGLSILAAVFFRINRSIYLARFTYCFYDCFVLQSFGKNKKGRMIVMKKSVICKLSIALAICCAVVCGVAIAPLAVSAVFALVALCCLLVSALIYIVGLLVWLFSLGQANILGYGATPANFGMGLFNLITPVAKFSIDYITPIAGWVAFGFGILGIIFASVGIARAKKHMALSSPHDNLPEETAMPEAESEAPGEKAGKRKKRKKKKKTEKGACIAALVVSIVFSVVALIAVLIAAVTGNLF